jgi:hypothetical protein
METDLVLVGAMVGWISMRFLSCGLRSVHVEERGSCFFKEIRERGVRGEAGSCGHISMPHSRPPDHHLHDHTYVPHIETLLRSADDRSRTH